ncbi:DNA mismatch repair protein MLH3 [Fasciola hepatica]|uniref:DNA mismatch repair protein MLH3 n=1 Tax=Fasciola hepatica TaxID=6192 RepID=A0A2H1BUR4_FASHE|nr:DNA mismatch repair protein MLH3 [Fasciola hepatica]
MDNGYTSPNYAVERAVLTSRCLKKSQIVGQVEDKIIFIVFSINSKDIYGNRMQTNKNETPHDPRGLLLVAVDQHAAHERVLLEQLENAWYKALIPWNSLYRDPILQAVPILQTKIPLRDKELIQFLEKDIQSDTSQSRVFGFDYEIKMEKESGQASLLLTKVPNLFVNGHCLSDEAKYNVISFMTALSGHQKRDKKQLLEKLRSIAYQFFQLKACRSAIRFGDRLTREEMKTLIQNLSKCRLPFQCAHGRPTCSPVAKLY